MEHGHVLAKAVAKTRDRLRRERDLGHQNDGAAPRGKGLLDGLQIDLGLAAARDAVDHHNVARAGNASLVNGLKGRDLPGSKRLGARGQARG